MFMQQKIHSPTWPTKILYHVAHKEAMLGWVCHSCLVSDDILLLTITSHSELLGLTCMLYSIHLLPSHKQFFWEIN